MLGIIVPLALTDAIGVGTLVVPLWLVTDSGWRPRLVALYLVALAVIYWLAGIVTLTSVRWGSGGGLPLPNGRLTSWLALAVGTAVALWGVWLGRRPRRFDDRHGRRWSADGTRPRTGVAVLLLAIGVSALELLSMAPYLSVIAQVAGSELSLSWGAAWLGVYVGVMLVPAVALAVLRRLVGEISVSLLTRLLATGDRVCRDAGGTILMAVGGLLAGNAAVQLGLVKA